MATSRKGGKKTTGSSRVSSTGRAKPMVPKAGVTRSHRRYGNGGQIK